MISSPARNRNSACFISPEATSLGFRARPASRNRGAAAPSDPLKPPGFARPPWKPVFSSGCARFDAQPRCTRRPTATTAASPALPSPYLAFAQPLGDLRVKLY
jgi:hypothetical protein